MNSKIFFSIFFILLLFGFAYSNQINYEINTQYPNSSPYYIGTNIVDLKILLVDSNKQILNYPNINNLSVKIGTNKYTFSKDSGNIYHLQNTIITKDMLTDGKLVLSIITSLEGSFTNTKQTYPIGDITEIIKLKNNPLDDYKTLTIGEQKEILLNFEDLKNQQISDLKCSLNSYDSETSFDCSKSNNCNYLLTVKEDTNTIPIYCTFNKTIKGTKTYPLNLIINSTLLEGLKIGEVTNPKNTVISNPFELCFTVLYTNGDSVNDMGIFKINLNDSEKEYYIRNNSFCYNKLLIPFTNLDENLGFSFNNKIYYAQITEPLNPGTYWTLFLIIVGIFILINIILILRAIFSRETMEDLTIERDNYKTKLKEIKEKYLQGDINKREFESKLNEYSIKVSYLNERILTTRKKEPKQTFDETIKEEKDTNNYKANKPSSELMNAIFSDNKEKVQVNDEDLSVDEAHISDESINNYTKELEKHDISQEEPKKENGFITFWKNLFKRKPKKENEPKEDQKQTNKEEKPNQEDLKQTFQGYNTDSEFDIKNWQK